MSEQEAVVFNLELQVSELSMSELRKLEMVTYRAISLMRRMGLPENIDKGVAKLQHFLMTIRMAHTALIALNAATMTNPLGLALAGIAFVGAGVTAYDFVRGL
jgi:hypothetical protein